MKAEVVHEGVKSSPPIAILGWSWMTGLTLNEVVALATLGYIALQAGYLVWKWFREWKKGRK